MYGTQPIANEVVEIKLIYLYYNRILVKE